MAVAIIILATFTAVTQYQVSDLTATAKQKEFLPLIASIATDKTTGIIPLEVSFTPIVSNAVGNVEYDWDFGDGNASKEMNPTYIYQYNGTFVCNLTVKDGKGKESSGFVKIIPIENHPPTVSIEADTTNPQRPNILALELWGKGFHIDNYAAADYRQLQKMGFLKPFFKQHESFFTVSATANDADGDEIVSYNWTLRPPSYTTRIGGKLVEPVFYYTGEEVSIPIEDIYPASADGYSLVLTVTDSAGQTRSETLKFKVQKSTQKEQRFARKATRDHFRTNTWNQLLAGFFGPYFRDALSSGFGSTGRFPIIKSVILIVAFNWAIIPFEELPDWFLDVIKPVLEKREGLANALDNLLLHIQEILEKHPKLIDPINIEFLREQLGLENNRPLISNPFPESGSINIPVNCPYVSITVEDPEGDPFNVTISGIYVNNITYSGQYNGTFTANLINPLPETEEIIWKVEVVDENEKSGAYINPKGEIIQGSEHKFDFKTLY